MERQPLLRVESKKWKIFVGPSAILLIAVLALAVQQHDTNWILMIILRYLCK
jgi:hypothetical protein